MWGSDRRCRHHPRVARCVQGGVLLLDLGLRVQGSGFTVKGSGFKVQGSGCRVQGSGFGVQGPGARTNRAQDRYFFSHSPGSGCTPTDLICQHLKSINLFSVESTARLLPIKIVRTSKFP